MSIRNLDISGEFHAAALAVVKTLEGLTIAQAEAVMSYAATLIKSQERVNSVAAFPISEGTSGESR